MATRAACAAPRGSGTDAIRSADDDRLRLLREVGLEIARRLRQSRIVRGLVTVASAPQQRVAPDDGWFEQLDRTAAHRREIAFCGDFDERQQPAVVDRVDREAAG